MRLADIWSSAGLPRADTTPGPAAGPASEAPRDNGAAQATPDAPPPPHRAAVPRWLVLAGVTLVYAGIAVAAYLPTLPLDGSHTQICTCGDTAQEVWFLSWAPFALAHGHSLFYTNWILYPAGVNLADNTSMPLLGILAAPVTLLAGPIAAYNLVLRAAFTLSALAMFVTVRRLVRWWPAAFAAGLLYGFSPFMVGQGLSHEFLVFAPIPPLVFGILIDLFGGRRLRARWAGPLLGLLAAAQFLISAETFAMLALFAVLASLLALCYRRARRRPGHLLATAGWAVVTCGLLLAYPLYMFFSGPQHIIGPPHALSEIYKWHGDLLGALLPGPLIRFAPAGLLHTGAALVSHNLQENGTYLGAPLVLAVIGLAVAYRRRPVTVIAAVLAVVSYALSLGTRIYRSNHATTWPGPFAPLSHIPVLQDIEPVRFSLFTALFAAAVLGTGLAELARPERRAAVAGRPGTDAADAEAVLAAAPAGYGAGEPSGTSANGPSAAGAGGPSGPGTVVPAGTTAAPGPAARAARWGRPVAAAAAAVAALLPLVPRFPYPPGPVVTPRLFTTPAVDRLPPGAVVVTLPYPARDANEALVWQAEAAMRFRLVGAAPFFVPGTGGASSDSRYLKLRPHGIDRVFEEFSAPGGTARVPLQPWLVAGVRTDLRRYHVSAVIIARQVEDGLPRMSEYGMPRPAGIGTVPGLALVVRYITAAIGRPPESVGGVLAWFHVAVPRAAPPPATAARPAR